MFRDALHSWRVESRRLASKRYAGMMSAWAAGLVALTLAVAPAAETTDVTPTPTPSVSRDSVVVKGPIAARLTFGSLYLQKGLVDVVIGIRSDIPDVRVGCLDRYQNFTYVLRDEQGRVVPTYDLSQRHGLQGIRNPWQCQESQWVYTDDLIDVYPSIPIGANKLTVGINIQGARSITLPSITLNVSSSSGVVRFVEWIPVDDSRLFDPPDN